MPLNGAFSGAWFAQNPEVALRAVIREEARSVDGCVFRIDGAAQRLTLVGSDDCCSTDALALELQIERHAADNLVAVAADVGQRTLVDGQRALVSRVAD